MTLSTASLPFYANEQVSEVLSLIPELRIIKAALMLKL